MADTVDIPGVMATSLCMPYTQDYIATLFANRPALTASDILAMDIPDGDKATIILRTLTPQSILDMLRPIYMARIDPAFTMYGQAVGAPLEEVMSIAGQYAKRLGWNVETRRAAFFAEETWFLTQLKTALGL